MPLTPGFRAKLQMNGQAQAFHPVELIIHILYLEIQQ